jgi:hypothetical protein
MPEENRKLKKYKVLKAYNQRALARKVQKYLKKGWEMQGGASVTGGFLWTAKTYTQAVALYKR